MQRKSKANFSFARCITPKRIASLRGPFPRHCTRQATQPLSKNFRSGGEPLATMCPIWTTQDLSLSPPAPETSALPLNEMTVSCKGIAPNTFTHCPKQKQKIMWFLERKLCKRDLWWKKPESGKIYSKAAFKFASKKFHPASILKDIAYRTVGSAQVRKQGLIYT